jgi:pilus assembly protein Flp/PilA
MYVVSSAVLHRSPQPQCISLVAGVEASSKSVPVPPNFTAGPGQEHLMKILFNRFARDESGATAIEYGLVAALIAVAAIAAMTTLGTKLTSTFTSVSNQLK